MERPDGVERATLNPFRTAATLGGRPHVNDLPSKPALDEVMCYATADSSRWELAGFAVLAVARW